MFVRTTFLLGFICRNGMRFKAAKGCEQIRMLSIKHGQIGTFTLDLRPNGAGNGTLTWSVGERSPDLIADDLLAHLKKHPTSNEFIPVVSTSKPTRVRLVNFRKLAY